MTAYRPIALNTAAPDWRVPQSGDTYLIDRDVDINAKFISKVADGASAVAHEFDTENDLATSGAKLLSLKNNGVEKASIDKDGHIFAGEELTLTPSNNSPVSIDNGVGNNWGVVLGGIKFHTSGSGHFIDAKKFNDFTVRVGSGLEDSPTGTIKLVGQEARPGAGGANISGGDITVTGGGGEDAASGDAHGGDVNIDGGEGFGTGNHGTINIAGTRGLLSFFGVTGAAQQAHIADPSGGATTDAEARTAINSILSALETYGLLAAS